MMEQNSSRATSNEKYSVCGQGVLENLKIQVRGVVEIARGVTTSAEVVATLNAVSMGAAHDPTVLISRAWMWEVGYEYKALATIPLVYMALEQVRSETLASFRPQNCILWKNFRRDVEKRVLVLLLSGIGKKKMPAKVSDEVVVYSGLFAACFVCRQPWGVLLRIIRSGWFVLSKSPPILYSALGLSSLTKVDCVWRESRRGSDSVDGGTSVVCEVMCRPRKHVKRAYPVSLGRIEQFLPPPLENAQDRGAGARNLTNSNMKARVLRRCVELSRVAGGSRVGLDDVKKMRCRTARCFDSHDNGHCICNNDKSFDVGGNLYGVRTVCKADAPRVSVLAGETCAVGLVCKAMLELRDG